MTDFRFNPYRVRQAGLPSTPYAKALSALWPQARRREEMVKVFGVKVVDYLKRNGHVALQGETLHITETGVQTLRACGWPPEEVQSC